MSIRDVEVDTLAELDAQIGTTDALNGWFVSSLDLTGRTAELDRVDPRGAVFLGCRFAEGVGDRLRAGGALLFPELPDVPFDPYRPRLYTPEELFGVEANGTRPPYDRSPDATIYAWTGSPEGRTLTGDLAATLHDHSVDGALDDVIDDLDRSMVVGVMGGHALRRRDPAYAGAARLGSGLARAGRTVLTGGGPGAMEAANLGAYLSTTDGALEQALTMLSSSGDYVDGIDAWTDAAFAVRERWRPEAAALSLSIPTWFYGHEPTNVFGTAIAKYFANALREDTLLHRCRGGIVFATGQAGTLQEIFQAANDRFYATETGAVAPLVLLGREYWTQALPAWQLLSALADDSPMAGAVHVVDDVDDALAIVTG